jgi:hypothetical protein
VHVKLVTADVGDVKVPLGADHAYPRLLGSGPVARAVSETDWPTGVSDGVTVTAVTVPQKYVCAPTATDPESAPAAAH